MKTWPRFVTLALAVCGGAAVARGQGMVAQQAATVAASARDDWRATATARLVPFPEKLPGIFRWTIDTKLHRGPVGQAALSPDATRVALGGFDGIIRIWNVDSGELERAIMAQRWGISQLTWSPDGRWLTTDGIEHRTRVFDAATGRVAKEFSGAYGALAWSTDSRRLAASFGGSGKIVVSDGFGDFKQVTETGAGVSRLAWSPDGRIAVASGKSAVVVIDGNSGRNLFSLEETDQRGAGALAWSPDGKVIASGVSSGPLLISDGSTGKVLKSLPQRVLRLAWAPDGRRIAAGDGGRVTIHAVDGTSASKPWSSPCELGLRWRTDPDRVVSVGATRVEVWKLDGQEPESAFPTSVGSAPPVFFPGRPIVTGLGSPTPTLWNPVTFTRIARLEGHIANVNVARWSPDGKLLATADAAGTIRTWEGKTGAAVDSFTVSNAAIAILEWSPDGKAMAVAVAGATATVQVLSPTGEKLAEVAGHAGGVSSLAWGANSEQLVTGGRDEKTVRWELPGGTEQNVIDDRGIPSSLAWQRQGQGQLAIGYGGGGLAIFNPTTGDLVTDIQGRGNGGSVLGVTWVEGNQPRLLAGGGAGVAVVDGLSGNRVAGQMVPNPQGSLVLQRNVVVTPGSDRSVRFWNLADSKALGAIVEDGSALAVVSATGSVAFDPDAEPVLMAVVERQDGSAWMPLAEFAKSCGWKNAPKSIKLPTKP